MATALCVTEGMRLTHTMHGDGKVDKIVERVNPKTKTTDTYAIVTFSALNGKLSWNALLNGRAGVESAAATSLTVYAPLSDIAEGSHWHVAEDFGDLSEILIDLEHMATKHSAVAPLGDHESVSAQIAAMSKNLERVEISPSGDPINVLKTVVDWTVARLYRQASSNGKSVSGRLADVNDWLAAIEAGDIWRTKLYPSIPDAIRSGTDRVLVGVSWLISSEYGIGMEQAAKVLLTSIEKRVKNRHLRGAELAKSRLEAQMLKSVVN